MQVSICQQLCYLHPFSWQTVCVLLSHCLEQETKTTDTGIRWSSSCLVSLLRSSLSFCTSSTVRKAQFYTHMREQYICTSTSWLCWSQYPGADDKHREMLCVVTRSADFPEKVLCWNLSSLRSNLVHGNFFCSFLESNRCWDDGGTQHPLSMSSVPLLSCPCCRSRHSEARGHQSGAWTSGRRHWQQLSLGPSQTAIRFHQRQLIDCNKHTCSHLQRRGSGCRKGGYGQMRLRESDFFLH